MSDLDFREFVREIRDSIREIREDVTKIRADMELAKQPQNKWWQIF